MAKTDKKDAAEKGSVPAAPEGKGEKGRKSPEKKPSKPPVKKPRSTQPKVSFFSRAGQFLREVRIELRKVTWPTRKETMASTSIVVILVFIVSVFLAMVDLGLTKFISLLIR